MLVLNAYMGLRKDSYFSQAPQRLLRQRQPAMCEQGLFLRHRSLLTPGAAQVWDNRGPDESFRGGTQPNRCIFVDPQ